MASELNLTFKLDYLKSGVSLSVDDSDVVDVTGTEVAEFIQSIGTSEEAVSVSDIGTQGYVYAKNLDATNYVELGLTGKLSIKLKAGKSALFRTGGALYGQANSSACRVKFIVIED